MIFHRGLEGFARAGCSPQHGGKSNPSCNTHPSSHKHRCQSGPHSDLGGANESLCLIEGPKPLRHQGRQWWTREQCTCIANLLMRRHSSLASEGSSKTQTSIWKITLSYKSLRFFAARK